MLLARERVSVSVSAFGLGLCSGWPFVGYDDSRKPKTITLASLGC